VFDEIASLWAQFDHLPAEALGSRETASSRIVPLKSAPPLASVRPHRLTRPAVIAAIAAMLVLAVGSVLTFGPMPAGVYRTAVGEQTTVRLADGSTVYLNTASRIKVHLTAVRREVTLVTGEALFSVAHDPDRPFLVRAGGGVIRAVGTEFNVYRKGEEVTVTVVEGVVEVAPAVGVLPKMQATSRSPRRKSLSKGEQLAYSLDDGSVRRIARVEPQRAVSWRKKRLNFDNQALAEVIAELNRYGRGQIVIVDDELAGIRVGGVFKVDDVGSVVAALERTLPIRVVRVTPYLTLLFEKTET